jgi:hypothetical protein
MSTAITMERNAEASPALKARMAGVVYLLSGFAYVFADNVVRGRLVVVGDAAATAHNILAHETLYRAGFATDLISPICFVLVTLLFYELFKPVNRSLSMLAAFFSLAGCVIQAISALFYLAPLVILDGTNPSLSNLEQMQTLALLSLKLRGAITGIYMIFFGSYNLLIGYLIFRSKFLPRILGVFMMLAGLIYQIFLWPPLAHRLSHYILAFGALGELSLVFWLLIFGVNAQRWKEQARAASVRCRAEDPLRASG